MRDSSDDSLVGRLLAGHYRVLARLGSGGFGTVYSALNVSLATEVAIKVARCKDDGARALREARTAARLTSPYSVRVFDVGELEGGTVYIVMERLHGRTLREYLKEEGPLPVELASCWLGQVCAAVREAHGLGLVHRDIKPSNIFVSEGPNVAPHLRLLDFGLAKAVEPQGELTLKGSLVGSPSYMSPEQVRAARVNVASDIWALGVVLYECLSLRLPFERESPSATLVAIAADPPAPLQGAAFGLPDAAARIVERCLRKVPSERFASVEELMTALAEWGGPPPSPARWSSAPSPSARTTAPTAQSTLGSHSIPRSVASSRTRPAASWLVGLGMAVGGAVLISAAPSPPAESPAVPASRAPIPPPASALHAGAPARITPPSGALHAGAPRIAQTPPSAAAAPSSTPVPAPFVRKAPRPRSWSGQTTDTRAREDVRGPAPSRWMLEPDF